MTNEILGIAFWKIAAVSAAVLVIVLLWLGWRLRRWWQAVRLGQRRRQGARGESAAVRLLRDAGYQIIEDQETATGCILVDGEPHTFGVRPDAIVERDGRRQVAEVKTGGAASIDARATRRQLLEYAYVFGVDGVLLVDMAAQRIHEVDFPGLRGIARAKA
jgi:hypothetical protein